MPDAGSETTLTRTLEVPALCAEAGRGEYGLVVQVAIAGDSESTRSEWVAPLGALSCP